MEPKVCGHRSLRLRGNTNGGMFRSGVYDLSVTKTWKKKGVYRNRVDTWCTTGRAAHIYLFVITVGSDISRGVTHCRVSPDARGMHLSPRGMENSFRDDRHFAQDKAKKKRGIPDFYGFLARDETRKRDSRNRGEEWKRIIKDNYYFLTSEWHCAARKRRSIVIA